MFSKWQWLLRQLTRTLWVRASLFAVLAIFTALIAVPIEDYFPNKLPMSIAADSVGSILNILASSMLAVTTFSLSVMVSAYGAASTGATPRAAQLVREDPTTQNVLATFIGSFLFSLVGIIALSADVYGENGRLILFAVTIAVVVIILVAILRWIEHLSVLGRVSETISRVENATYEALKSRVDYPHLGAKQLLPEWEAPESGMWITAAEVGWVRHIDVSQLNEIAKTQSLEFVVVVEPGDFVCIDGNILWCSNELSETCISQIHEAFTIGVSRSFDQDGRFGLQVLAEIASRALSPAVNDPGTAIDVLGRAVRLMVVWKDHEPLDDHDERICYPHIRLAALKTDELFEDVFLPIARDGAHLMEIQLLLQKSLYALARLKTSDFSVYAKKLSNFAMEYSEQHISLKRDSDKLQELSKLIDDLG